MTDTTLVCYTHEAQEYKNPIATRFFECYEAYRKTGKKFSPRDVLGPAPRIPDSPDMDTRLEAYEDLAKYSRKYKELEEKISLIMEKGA